MTKKLLALALAALMALSLFAACGAAPAASGSAPADTSTSTPDDSSEAPVATGAKEIIVNLGSEPPEMNSILTTSTGSMNVLRHIVDGLTMLDQNDAPVPAVAESWEYDEETLTYTFTLRQGIKWSNGEEVTANDFVFSWDTFFTADTGAMYASTWAPIILGATEKLNGKTPEGDVADALAAGGYEDVGYKAIDDYTLQVTMGFPCAYFLDVLAFPSMFPINQKGYEEIGADQYGTEADLMLTNGAFTFAGWTHQNEIVLEKNPEYWDADNIKLEKITMLMITDSGTALNTFLAGDIDMIGLTGDQSQQLKGDGYEILYYDDGSCWYFEFNNTHPGLKNAKVREALTLAIDAEAFIENLVKNSSIAAYSFVPPAIANGEFTEKVGKIVERVENDDYSEVKALLEEGLAEEGIDPASFSPVLIADDTDTAGLYCAFYQEQWKTHLGIDITIEQMTYDNRIDRMQQHDFDIVMAGWGPDYNDPMTFLDLFVTGSGNNHTQYSNPAYDELVAKAMVEPDEAARDELMIEIEKIIATDFMVGPIYNRRRDYVTSEKLTGVVRTAFIDMSFRWCDVVA